MRIGVDIGGTFTDFVIYDESTGHFSTFKRLSTPAAPEAAVLRGLEDVLGDTQTRVIHGSTVATNALLERKGARTALVTTRGFRDILTIGRQHREDIYDFFADRPEPLVPPERSFEVTERVDYTGEVLTPLDTDDLPALLEELQAAEIESVAVSLLFSFLHPAHEQKIAEVLRDHGYVVSLSSDIVPEFREYERTSTTAINAYVSPIMNRYIARLQRGLGDTELRIMQSNGGTIRADVARRHAVRSILSGPAGGVVGALHVAGLAGVEQVISFDMGGTSTDVFLSQGDVHVTSEADIGGLPIRIPVVDIHTVGSGGGSIAHVDAGGALRVGPQSAGADPGPVCYGRGGTRPTVTDANLVLGRLVPDHFLGGEMALDVESAVDALDKLAVEAGISATPGLSRAQTAALGVIDIANVQMTRAARVISVERGYDPGDFALVSFGGAGGLHACDLARALAIGRVLVPSGASTLSAFGMLAADVVKDYVQTVMLPADTAYAEIESRLAPLVSRGTQDVRNEGVPAKQIVVHRELDMRYEGQSYELTIPYTPDYVEAFHRAHRQNFGHSEPAAPVEIVNVRVRTVGLVDPPPLRTREPGPPDPTEALIDRRPVVVAEGAREGGAQVTDVPIYAGARLRPGHVVAGPALIAQSDTTVLLAGGDRATVAPYDTLNIEVHP